MTHFKVRDASQAPEVTAHHRDLGRCYVDEVTIGIRTILIATPVDEIESHGNSATFRVQRLTEELKKHGLYLITGSLP